MFFTAAQHSFTVSLVHLPGRLNCIVDALSCNRSHVSFPLLPRPTSCQHQCLPSWESSRRPPEPPPHLHRAMAPSTSTTYRAGIRKYYTFCHTLGITPLPGTKHSINLFAAYLSRRKLQANTIRVYLAAVSHLHLTQGYCSPAHNNPMLNLAILRIQHTSGPRDCL